MSRGGGPENFIGNMKKTSTPLEVKKKSPSQIFMTPAHIKRPLLNVYIKKVASVLAIINGLNGSLLDKYLCTCTLITE